MLVLLPMASAVKNLSDRVRLTKAICGCVEDAECRCPWRDVLRVPFDNRKVGKGHLGGWLHLSSGSTCCFECPWNMYLLAGILSSSCPHIVVSSWNQVVLSRRGAPKARGTSLGDSVAASALLLSPLWCIYRSTLTLDASPIPFLTFLAHPYGRLLYRVDCKGTSTPNILSHGHLQLLLSLALSAPSRKLTSFSFASLRDGRSRKTKYTHDRPNHDDCITGLWFFPDCGSRLAVDEAVDVVAALPSTCRGSSVFPRGESTRYC